MKFNLKDKFSSLIMNNKVIAVVSVIMSFVIWMWIAIEKSPIETTVIKGVPVSFEMEGSVPEQLGLKIFGDTEYSVDITVSGKRFVLQTLDKSKFTVTAQTNYVDSAGSKSLLLKAETLADCDIIGLSQNYIEVFFDSESEKEFTIEPVVNSTSENVVPEDLMLGNVVLSQSLVKISGPSSEINSISGVKAVVNLEGELTSTSTFTPKLVFEGADKTEHLSMNIKSDEVTMTVPVLKVVTLDTTVTFKNTPTKYINSPLRFTVYPSTLTVAVPVENIDTVKNVSVATIDFANINSGYNTYTFKTSEISDYRVISDISSVRVEINARGYISQEYTIPSANISITDQRSGFTATVESKSIENVTVIGTEEDLQQLTNAYIYAEIDLSSQQLKAGSNTVEATIVVKGNGACWGYGKYEVVVNAAAQG
jgi:hypothetical protein